MAKGTQYSPKEFAAAYIQTLPHSKDVKSLIAMLIIGNT